MMLQKSLCLSVLLLTMWTGSLLAQDCDLSISGRVLDSHDSSPLEFSSLYVVQTGEGVVSDLEGNYKIKGLCPGKYDIICGHLGCVSDTFTVQLRRDVRNRVFTLEHHAEELMAIEVKAEKAEREQVPSRWSLDESSIDNSAGSNLGDMLKEIPGVSTLQTGPTISKPVVHGMTGSRVVILNNGVRQEGQQWGSEHAPAIDPFVAQKLTVIKGAASVRYGAGAVGGVVLVEPNELPTKAGLNGKVGLTAASNGRQGTSSALLQGGVKGIDGLGWRAQGTLKKAGDYHAADYQLTNTGVQEGNFSLAAGYNKEKYGLQGFYSSFNTELGILRAAHIGNLTDLRLAISSDRPLVISPFSYDINVPRQEVAHRLLKAKGYLRLADKGKLLLTYARQDNRRKEFDIRRGNRSDIPALDLDLVTHSVDMVWEGDLRSRWQPTFGANGSYQENINVPGTGIRPLIPNYRSTSGGAFFIGQYNLERWVIEAGARYDHQLLEVYYFDRANVLQQPTHVFDNFAGSLGASFIKSEQLTFSSDLSTSFRPPNISELYSQGLHHGAAAIEEGNASLQNEYSVKWVNSVVFSAERLHLSADIYGQYFQNYIALSLQGVDLTIRGAFPAFQYVQQDALFGGLDAQADYDLTEKLVYGGKLSFVIAQDLKHQAPLPAIPNPSLSNRLTYTWVDLKGFESMSVHVGLSTYFRPPYAPRAINVDTLVILDSEELTVERDRGAFDLLAPPTTYHMLSAGASAKLPIGENRLSLGLQVTNALDVSYRNYMDRFRYYADGLGRNIILNFIYSF